MEHQRKHEHETKLDIENMKLRVKRLKVELSALEDIEKKQCAKNMTRKQGR
jgi:hypothetical protein